MALTSEQIEAVKYHPRYQHLTKKLNDFPDNQSEAHRAIYLERKSFYERLKTKMLREIWAEWAEKQGVDDIERHFRGEDLAEAPLFARASRPMSAVQERMVEALTAPLIRDLTAIRRRRMEAIYALIAYCGEEERVVNNMVLQTRPPSPVRELEGPGTFEEQMELVKKTTLTSVVGGDEVRKCFICVCRAANDGKSHPKLAERTRHYSRQGTLGRYFITAYLDFMNPEDSFECQICFCTLIYKKHLQNHA